MTRPALEVLVEAVAGGFAEIQARFALVGGLAVGARVGPRFTRDADFAVAVAGDEQAQAFLGHFIRRGFSPEADIHDEAAGRLHTMRLASPQLPEADPEEGQPVVDLLFNTSGIESETVAAATLTPVFPGITLPTARIPHLIAMKVLSESDARLQDRIDLQNLVAAATQADLHQVPQLLSLIADRGNARGKDLRQVFDGFCPKRS